MPITRRAFSGGAFAPLASAGQAPQTPRKPGPPNIVFFLFDKCRTDAIGAYGGKVHTPNLDWLAQTGVRFASCYTPQALCGPARASILTGMYPHAHGLRKNVYPISLTNSNNTYPDPIPNPFEDARFRLADNFPHLLHNAGYETCHIGKWHLGAANPGYFDTWKSFNSLLPHWIGKPHESAYRPDVHTDQGIRFIEQNADRPFFLYQSYYAPHEPLDPPKQYRERYKHLDESLAGYHGAVANLDSNVGRILDTLRKQNAIDNTLIIMTTEHGRTWDDRIGTKEGMSICYEDAARIPMILRHPRLLPSGKVWNAGVSLVDLMPTILDAAGVSAGSPVLSGLRGGDTQPAHGRSLIAEVSRKDEWNRPVVIQNISQSAHHGSYFEERGIRSGKWKLILRKFDIHPTMRDDELYDVEADPAETKNLFTSNPTQTRRMAEMLAKWAGETGDTLGMDLARRASA